MSRKYSRHPILCTAIEFSAPVPAVRVTKGAHVLSVFTSSRPIQNCLAPLILGKKVFPSCGDKLMNYLLDHCDTTRFATKLVLPRVIDDALATRLLQRMDYVMEINIMSTTSITDALMPVILALSHLQRVRFISTSYTTPNFTTLPSRNRPARMSYQGTIKPLLHHPHESVRRSVALSLHADWLSPLSQRRKRAVYQDDFLPLLDSASNNGSIHDALVAACVLSNWSFLPRDLVREYFQRALRFLTAPSSHKQLCRKALSVIHSCVRKLGASETISGYEVLPMLPRLIRDGKVEPSSSGFSRLLRFILKRNKNRTLWREQMYDLHLLDLAYDTYLCPPRVLQTDAMGLTGVCDTDDDDDHDDDEDEASSNMGIKHPLSSSGLMKLFQAAVKACPRTFLQRSSIVPKLIQTVLVPWHRSVLAVALSLYHRSSDRSVGCLNIIDTNAHHFPPIPDDVHNAMHLVVRCLDLNYEGQVDEEGYFATISRLLFDEYEGFYCLPVLQTYIHLAVAHPDMPTNSVKKRIKHTFSTLSLAREHEEALLTGFGSTLTIRLWMHPPSEGSYPPESYRVRRARRLCDDNERNGVAPRRWYLSELTMEDEVVFNALKRSPPERIRRMCDCGDSDCSEFSYDESCDEFGYDHDAGEYITPDPYAEPKDNVDQYDDDFDDA